MWNKLKSMLPVSAKRHAAEVRRLEGLLKEAAAEHARLRNSRDRMNELLEMDRDCQAKLVEKLAVFELRPHFKDRSGVVQVFLDGHKLAAILAPRSGDSKDPLRNVLCDHIGGLVASWLKRAVFHPTFLQDGRDSGYFEGRLVTPPKR